MTTATPGITRMPPGLRNESFDAAIAEMRDALTRLVVDHGVLLTRTTCLIVEPGQSAWARPGDAICIGTGGLPTAEVVSFACRWLGFPVGCAGTPTLPFLVHFARNPDMLKGLFGAAAVRAIASECACA